MSIKLMSPPIRINDKPRRQIKSLYISDKTKELMDFLQSKSGMSQDETMYDALILYKNALEQLKGEKYEI